MDLCKMYWKFLFMFISFSKGDTSYLVFVHQPDTWMEAQNKCHSFNGGHMIDFRDEMNNECTRPYFKRLQTCWSDVYTSLTPYISHHGCYILPRTLVGIRNTTMTIPSVGACYDHCRDHTSKFGVMENICLCFHSMDEYLINKTERMFCNYSCNVFHDKEYCGGQDRHFNLYNIREDRRESVTEEICFYLFCKGPIERFDTINCARSLLGRVCGNDAVHMNDATFIEARNRCGPSYLRFDPRCYPDKLQSNVNYWIDVKNYQILKHGTDYILSQADIPYMCLVHDYLHNESYFDECAMMNSFVCMTDGPNNDGYPSCLIDNDEPDITIPTTENGETESSSTYYEMTKGTDCEYCATQNKTASTNFVSTEPIQMERKDGEFNATTIWGPIIGVIIITGCVLAVVLFYRCRKTTKQTNAYEKRHAVNVDIEDPNRNYFVLEAKSTERNSAGINKTTYDNAHGQIMSENEGVYAENSDGVYDHLGEHRHLKGTQDGETNDIYTEGTANTATDSGDYNTLNKTYRQRDALSIITDGDGYGHLKDVDSNRIIESEYDHC